MVEVAVRATQATEYVYSLHLYDGHPSRMCGVYGTASCSRGGRTGRTEVGSSEPRHAPRARAPDLPLASRLVAPHARHGDGRAPTVTHFSQTNKASLKNSDRSMIGGAACRWGGIRIAIGSARGQRLAFARLAVRRNSGRRGGIPTRWPALFRRMGLCQCRPR